MNIPGAGADGAGSARVPSWPSIAVFTLLAPALVVAVSFPAVTLATVAGFALGTSARKLPIDRVKGRIASIRTPIAGPSFGPAGPEFEPVEDGVE